MPAPQVVFNERDYAHFLQTIAKGRACVLAITERGPIGIPTLCGSVAEFERKFGRLLESHLGPFLLRRALERGAPLYISRVEHYTDASDPTTLVATKSISTLQDRGATFASKTLGSTVKVKYTSKIQGADGNDISIEQIDPDAASQPLTVSVAGMVITVTLATNSGKSLISTAAQVAAAVNAHILARQLVFAEVTVAGTAEAVVETALTGGGDSANTLKISAKTEGAWSANSALQFKITESRDADRFNLEIQYTNQPRLSQTWTDLSMNPEDARYAPRMVNARTELVVLEDLDPGTLPFGTRCPRTSVDWEDFGADGVGDGSAVVNADFIGDSGGKTGLYSFDTVDDALYVAIPEADAEADNDLLTAGAAYCQNRMDMIYLQATPALSPQAAVDWRNREGTYSGTAVDSSYAALIFGHLTVPHPTQGQVEIPPAADAIAAMIKAFDKSKYRAPAGLEMGAIPGVISIHENVGSSGRLTEADLLSDNQVNYIAAFSDEPACIWDQHTLQRISSPLQNIHTRMLLILMRRACMKINRIDLFRPHLPMFWRLIYRRLQAFMDELKGSSAIESYDIQCDQFASTPEDAKIQTAERRERGEFLVYIYFKPVSAIRWIGIEAVITSKSVSFQEMFELTNPTT